MTITVDFKELHSGQQQVIECIKRFNLLRCGRRFGKTEMGIELLCEPAIEGHPVGWFAPDYKTLFEVWERVKDALKNLIAHRDENKMRIKLFTGGIIEFWTLENKDAGRGRKYKRVICDETQSVKVFFDIWKKAIRPTLIDLRGDAFFFFTPKGKNSDMWHMEQVALQNERQWAVFQLPSSANPYLPPGELEDAKLDNDPITFRQEYLAEYVETTNRPFAFAFDDSRHVGEVQALFQPKQELYLSFDFNVDPMTCIAAQIVGNNVRILREFRLPNSDIYAMCAAIQAAYPGAMFTVTGDRAGNARTALNKGNLTAYRIIQDTLRIGPRQLKVAGANPAHRDSRAQLNVLLNRHPSFKIDKSCKFLLDDLRYVECKDDGTIDKGQDKHRTHLLDCLRYFCWTFLPKSI